jgi:sacsin
VHRHPETIHACTALPTAQQVGTLGAPLTPSDASLLQLKPLRRYRAGELVAASRAHLAAAASAAGLTLHGLAPAAAADAAGSAAERRAAAAAQAQAQAQAQARGEDTPVGEATQSDDVYVYARVAANCEPRQAVYQVPLEAGGPGETLALLSSQVYSFASSASQGHGAGDDGDGDGAADGAGAGAGAGQAAAPVQSTEGRQHEVGGAPVPPAARQGQQQALSGAAVGSRQLVGAVKDLLAAAGLPLDLQREELLSQATELQVC